MDARLKLLFFFVDLVLPLLVGYALCRTRVMRKETSDRIMVVNLLTLAPLLAALSFWTVKLDVTMIWLPILGVVMQVIPGAVGYATVRRKYAGPLEQGSYIMSTMLSNRGVVGVLTVYILFGEPGYAWSQLVMLLAPVTLYMFCFPLAQYFQASHSGDSSSKPSLQSILFSRNQLALLGIVAGVWLNLRGIERPAVMDDAFGWLVHLFSWAFVLPLGFTLDLREMKPYWRDMIDLLAIKFILTPLAMYPICLAAGLSGHVLDTLIILAASPTAIQAVIAGRINKLNVHLTMAAFVLTTVVYMVAVLPVLLLIYTVR